jgi:hypothetical protein
MPGFGGYDDEERILFTMKTLMRMIEIRDLKEQAETLSKQDIETQLSFLGIRYAKEDMANFQKFIDDYYNAQEGEDRERVIFKFSFKLVQEVVRKQKPALSTPEYEDWKLLKKTMLYIEHRIEKSTMVPEDFKKIIRTNVILWFKDLYSDFEAMSADRKRDKEDRFDNAILHAAGDVVPSYEKIMSTRVTSKKMKDEFEESEIEEDEVEEYDDY